MEPLRANLELAAAASRPLVANVEELVLFAVAVFALGTLLLLLFGLVDRQEPRP